MDFFFILNATDLSNECLSQFPIMVGDLAVRKKVVQLPDAFKSASVKYHVGSSSIFLRSQGNQYTSAWYFLVCITYHMTYYVPTYIYVLYLLFPLIN